jgi:hypothetical protein
MINAYEFNDSQKREVKRRLEAWNPAMVRDTYERTKRIETEAAVEDPTVEGGVEAKIEAFGGKSQQIELDDVAIHTALDMTENIDADPEEELDFDPYEDITELAILSGYQEPESYVGRFLIARKDRFKVPAGTIVEVIDQSEEYLSSFGVVVEWGEIENGYWQFCDD